MHDTLLAELQEWQQLLPPVHAGRALLLLCTAVPAPMRADDSPVEVKSGSVSGSRERVMNLITTSRPTTQTGKRHTTPLPMVDPSATAADDRNRDTPTLRSATADERRRVRSAGWRRSRTRRVVRRHHGKIASIGSPFVATDCRRRLLPSRTSLTLSFWFELRLRRCTGPGVVNPLVLQRATFLVASNHGNIARMIRLQP